MPNETITAPQGFRAGAAAAGIKTKRGELDVGVIVADTLCSAAAVFTRNRFCGAPVVVGREHVAHGRLRAVVVNSGCSNVATGQRGIADAREMCKLTAERIGADPTEVLPASTGVIGHFLPMDKIRRGINAAIKDLSDSAEAGERFNRAIMTTDLKMKQAFERVRIGGQPVSIAGCCKGSGMIAPNMATMLAYITTDAEVPPRLLRALLRRAVEPTFNRVTVDECPSTSDTVAILASGLGARLAASRDVAAFGDALQSVCARLAYAIAEDGEGATRVLEIIVDGAKTPRDAHRAARAIAVSPLVKTAVHGGDPNWGRIVQALGATDVEFDPARVTVWLDKTRLFSRGAPARNLDLKKLSKLMRRKHVSVRVHLDAGEYRDRILTCDLSRQYIAINADYHT
ncbi:MAG TPA: bifunctional glutamate N-acetyltransferase/amino-acid acetyltransferase ArgJ [Phycisphaerae bacterium]|jgi:glutamate N-acetyltransferase/amino-acid N-acetyltransferase|nr:bifunctional glutamate N-acetyltransferase/amino-acid acetyltransferase ArgJ [Phycisphaerae bacterium]HOB73724.1 bifunctional glutamate N-acetyltransferase/amino-acid acetyltransferase ArgJ [Phycisphaerae bacterium]HOJ53402.1 bifunctional glutamate N-acetyltransferase/amino-acid acetyltransferase ArgJ [Phycisphaerae bacterium]HOL25474.1 bifunctional glutamate N-acetyltransferase/amino-acid acetyltransferase ArgJ [Phycisphaerae bacterium]HPP19849.1 bifunctional glutamate N-acetyltransferase/a